MDWIIENRHMWLIAGLSGYLIALLSLIGLLIRITQLQKLESYLDAFFNDRLIDIFSYFTVYMGIYSTAVLIIYLILEFIIK